MSITALTVARARMSFNYPGVQSRCLHGREFKRAADVQAAWFDAIDLVDTSHFFFIDDDDELPPGHADVLERCLDSGTAIAYTDELVNGERRTRAPYTQEAHLKDPTLLHHLVLCDTALARDVVRDLLTLLARDAYWEMAARRRVPGSAPLNKGSTGLHREWFTVLGIPTHRWCAENPQRQHSCSASCARSSARRTSTWPTSSTPMTHRWCNFPA